METADTLKLQGCTSFKLRRLTRVVSRRYDAHVAASGLKTSQYSLLSHVLHLGPIRPVDLAQAMNVDASTLTRNLKPTVAAGWLELGEGADARSRLVTITAAGRAKRKEAQAMWHRAQVELNKTLGAQRVQALHALIDESLAILGADGSDEGDD